MGGATVATRYWHRTGDGRVQCDVCPRACRLHEGQRGFCFVRMRRQDAIVLTTYGRSSGYCVDPVEKKPLNHFLPSSAVLSFGTAGCNLGCRFCQNWDISKSRETDTLADEAAPPAIARAAARLGCRSVAFTYNDPVIFLEYAIDVADACHQAGIKAVAVTAGYLEQIHVLRLMRNCTIHSGGKVDNSLLNRLARWPADAEAGWVVGGSIHSVATVFAREVGLLAGDPVDRDQGAVEDRLEDPTE